MNDLGFLHPHQRLTGLLLLTLAILIGVQWYLMVVLLYSTLMNYESEIFVLICHLPVPSAGRPLFMRFLLGFCLLVWFFCCWCCSLFLFCGGVKDSFAVEF